MAGKVKKWGLAAALAVIVTYAWMEGGEEQLHDISYPVAVDGAAR